MALGPIDYSADVQAPMQSVLQGFQQGAGLRQMQIQQQQQEAQLQQQKQQQQVIQALVSNKNATAADYANATLLVPQLKDQFEASWKLRSAGQQEAELSRTGQLYAALQGDRPDVAAQLVDDHAVALENSGDTQGAQQARTLSGLIKENPQFARSIVGMKLASVPGGDKVVESIGKLGTEQRAADAAPADLRAKVAGATKAEADAETAKITAKFAEQNAVKDLEKKGWDIKKVVSDIETQREANRIAAMNAAIAREGNQLKREELQLKVQEARQALDDKIRAKVAEAASGATTIDTFLNTIDRFRGMAVDKDGKPTSTLRAAAGPIDARLPTVQSDVADLEAMVDTLRSQAFLSQVPTMKGTGNLSDAEGKKLDESLANLSLKQSPEQLIANVNEAYRLANKARKNLALKTGVPMPAIDTPAATPRTGSSAFQPGATPPATTKSGATVSGW